MKNLKDEKVANVLSYAKRQNRLEKEELRIRKEERDPEVIREKIEAVKAANLADFQEQLKKLERENLQKHG